MVSSSVRVSSDLDSVLLTVDALRVRESDSDAEDVVRLLNDLGVRFGESSGGGSGGKVLGGNMVDYSVMIILWQLYPTPSLWSWSYADPNVK